MENEGKLEELLEQLKDENAVIPDAVAQHYLHRAGFHCPDEKVQRIICLAAQKFISEIADDAMQYTKIREQGPSGLKKARTDLPVVLTMEDVSESLREYGISIRKPDYFADKVNSGQTQMEAKSNRGGGHSAYARAAQKEPKTPNPAAKTPKKKSTKKSEGGTSARSSNSSKRKRT